MKTSSTTTATKPAEKLGLWLRHPLAAMMAVSVFWVTMAIVWRWTPLHEHLNLQTLTGWEQHFGRFAWAPVVLPLIYAVFALVAFPHVLLLWATLYAFPPAEAFIYMELGSLASALTLFGLGRALGRHAVSNLVGTRVHSVSVALGKHAKKTLTLLHIFPIIPFHFLNLISGASHIRFRDFIWGTVLGMTPGILFLCWFGPHVLQTFRHPTPGRIAIVVIVLIGGFLCLRYGKKKILKDM